MIEHYNGSPDEQIDYDARIAERRERVRVLKDLINQECRLLANDLTERMTARDAAKFRPSVIRFFPANDQGEAF